MPKFALGAQASSERFIVAQIPCSWTIQAGIGLGELGSIDHYLARKRRMAAKYQQGLGDLAGLTLPSTKAEVENVYWMYAILVDQERFGISKDDLRKALKGRGVDTRDMFYSPSQQPVLTERYGQLGPFPNTDRIAATGLYLPSGLALTEDDIDYVIAQVRKLAQGKA